MKQELLKFNQAEAVQLVNGLLIKKKTSAFIWKIPQEVTQKPGEEGIS